MNRYLIAFLLVFAAPLAASATESDLAKVKAELARQFPEIAAGDLRPSPVPGLLELQVGGEVMYVSRDGKFIVLGEVVEVATRKNLTTVVREQAARDALAKVSENEMIVIGPSSPKRTITVFTDVDCPYCLALHRDVPELNRNGVKVRYLLFPRGGIDSETYRRSVAVWCAKDRAEAVGKAKAGEKIEMKTCVNPVEKHYKLGQSLGVTGTPTIFLEDGKRLSGYAPVPQMLAVLGLKAAPAQAAR